MSYFVENSEHLWRNMICGCGVRHPQYVMSDLKRLKCNNYEPRIILFSIRREISELKHNA